MRVEFLAGIRALEYVQKQEGAISEISASLGADRHKITESVAKSQDDAESARRRLKHLMRRTREHVAGMAVKEAEQAGDVLFYSVTDDEMDADYHIAVGESAAKLEPRIVYCALVTAAGKSVKIAVCCGKDARKIIGAGTIVKEMSKILGGSGGGSDAFAQGGGKDSSKSAEAIKLAYKLASGKDST